MTTAKRPRTMPEDQERAIRDGAEPWDAVRILAAEIDAERRVSDDLAAAGREFLSWWEHSGRFNFTGEPHGITEMRAALARWEGKS